MKQINFANGKTFQNIVLSAIPLFGAQLLNLLYNIVDRFYIGKIPDAGLAALGGVGLCFPVISLITAFTNLFGTGGAPLSAISMGAKDHQRAQDLMNTSCILLLGTSVIITIAGMIFCKPLLMLFGASASTIQYAWPYMMIYLAGTVFAMFSLGMNPFINAQGFPTIGMISILIGAVINIVLDPILIFTFDMGVAGAAWATIFSQFVSAAFVFWFLTSKRPLLRLSWQSMKRFSWKDAGDITGLGSAGFMMQFTNTLVQIVSNALLAGYGDLYITIMTVASSIRQILDTPILAITDGASPVLSFNYGAGNGKAVRQGIWILSSLAIGYTLIAWGILWFDSAFFIRIFNKDPDLLNAAIPAVQVYLFGYVFQAVQFSAQAVFKSLNRKKQAIFFSIFRKVVIGIPCMFLLPPLFRPPVLGIFAAEPVSNIVCGTICYITMLVVILPALKTLRKPAVTAQPALAS